MRAEDIVVKTIPGNMYHFNTCEINFTKKSKKWSVIIIIFFFNRRRSQVVKSHTINLEQVTSHQTIQKDLIMKVYSKLRPLSGH